jgi:hypothetical protein
LTLQKKKLEWCGYDGAGIFDTKIKKGGMKGG